MKDYPSVHDESSITYSNSTVNAKLGMTFGYDSLLAINQRGQAVGDTVMTYERYADSGFLHYYKLNLKTQSCGSDPDRGEECDPASLLLMQVWGSYAYDKLGNSSTETVETGNRLRSYAGYTLNYDADGNLTSKTKTGYSQLYYWDALGQLDSVKTNGVKDHVRLRRLRSARPQGQPALYSGRRQPLRRSHYCERVRGWIQLLRRRQAAQAPSTTTPWRRPGMSPG